MALARALAVDPQVLLLDEPFGALDAKVRDDLRKWLRRLHEEVGVTTVLVTHDQQEALDVSDRIAVLNKGAASSRSVHPTTCTIARRTSSSHRFWGRPSGSMELVRPHDIRIGRNPELALPAADAALDTGIIKATVDRVVHLGFETASN